MRTAPFLLALLLAAPPARSAPLDDIQFEAWGRRELSYLDRKPYFLTREELLSLPLVPPPRNSSGTTRDELDELLKLQAARTRAERRAIERHRSYPGVCGALIEVAQRDLGSAPKTNALLTHLELDASLAVFSAKRRFNRPRPNQLDSRIQPAIPVPAHAAYPSGHALQGYLVSRVMAAIFPDHRDELMARGIEIGREREIAGLHYPSDSAASRRLGEALYARLEKNEKFVRELAAAKSEWRCQGQ
jgi:acid phosphatase (class A)